MQEEECGEFETSNSDPEFTLEELARIAKLSRRKVLSLVSAAKLGRHVVRRGDDGEMQSTVIVRYSELTRLRREFEW